MNGIKVENGVVVDIAVFNGSVFDGWIEAPEGVTIGYTDNGDGTFTAPPLAPADPVNPKMTGVLFEGTMCSATAKDMWGLSSVQDWVLAGNDVNFHFENGNTLLLTSSNFADFQAVWIPFRASFF